MVLETSGVPIMDEQGLVVGYRGIDRDITERKLTEQNLRESEEHSRQVFEINQAVKLIVGPLDGRLHRGCQPGCLPILRVLAPRTHHHEHVPDQPAAPPQTQDDDGQRP
ncbi:hypothetical protein DFAR_370003 [Desulfarculales bacterium]